MDIQSGTFIKVEEGLQRAALWSIVFKWKSRVHAASLSLDPHDKYGNIVFSFIL
jgi:hypothetical protein